MARPTKKAQKARDEKKQFCKRGSARFINFEQSCDGLCKKIAIDLFNDFANLSHAEWEYINRDTPSNKLRDVFFDKHLRYATILDQYAVDRTIIGTEANLTMRLADNPSCNFNALVLESKLLGYAGEGSILTAIDYTNSIDKIIEIVTKIKNDFDANPEAYGRGRMADKYPAELAKHKEPKPLYGKLADILFIADCKRFGLDENYIRSEIDNYWNNAKNLHRESISDGYYGDCLKLAKKYCL